MFDEPTPPSNLPTGGKEPEDIFEKIEPAKIQPSAGFPSGSRPVSEPLSAAPPPSAPVAAPGAEVKEPLIASRKVIVVLGVVLGVLVVAGIAYGALRFVRRSASPAELPPTSQGPFQVETDLTPPEIPTLPSPPPLEIPQTPSAEELLLPQEPTTAPAPAPDSDNDGLSDEEEVALGTDPQNADSDNDSLFDGEEVKTYTTDPLSADTDGDTFLDGTEVRSGYNPKGQGRLFTVPSQ